MEKVIVIKKIRNVDILSKEANQLIDKFNASGRHLQLVVYTGYENADLETILDEGAYDYVATDEIEEMLYELADNARPMMFEVEDVLAVR